MNASLPRRRIAASHPRMRMREPTCCASAQLRVRDMTRAPFEPAARKRRQGAAARGFDASYVALVRRAPSDRGWYRRDPWCDLLGAASDQATATRGACNEPRCESCGAPLHRRGAGAAAASAHPRPEARAADALHAVGAHLAAAAVECAAEPAVGEDHLAHDHGGAGSRRREAVAHVDATVDEARVRAL